MSSQAAMSNLNAEASSRAALFKLLAFSVMLGVLPIGSYFASRNYLWEGNDTYAAITAIVAAQFVLVSYIIVAVVEDRQQGKPLQGEKKKPAESKKDK
ncbi:hypothetical protein D9619_000519 [Psilocybe cf. subviscida]|uniref:Vacuolar ATPase assembly integral membrane protein VMA21 n=1 Tax=Psilocybe cf. subviscida TaxID=2480587 RepID=A0A8H5BCV8_9AGAR|nr:hypothetical protein D9619_000519 [Psilocybe cf. subviscida]